MTKRKETTLNKQLIKSKVRQMMDYNKHQKEKVLKICFMEWLNLDNKPTKRRKRRELFRKLQLNQKH